MPPCTLTLTRELPLALREAAPDAPRSIRATLATEAQVAVYDPASRRIVEEILLMSGARLDRQCPLLLDHDRSIRSQVGSVGDLAVEGDRLGGSLRFAHGTTPADEAWQLVIQGHARAVSVGYTVLDGAEIPAGRTEIVAGRSFTAPHHRPLRVTTAWALREVSLVPIPADAAAGIRAAADFPNRLSERNPMTRTYPTYAHRAPIDDDAVRRRADAIAGAVEPMLRQPATLRWPDFFRAALRYAGERVAEDEVALVRDAVSSAVVSEALAGLVGTAIVRGAQRQPDTTLGLYALVDVPTFQPVSTFGPEVAARLEKLPRGGTAAHILYGLAGRPWRIARYAAKATLDEQDLLDGAPIGLRLLAYEELGRAAARVRLDLFWSLVLRNPAGADGKALFHADHGNLGAVALDATNLAAAMAAVAGQTVPDAKGDPVHLNAEPRVLVVPPALAHTARALARDVQLDDGGDIEVRVESRIGPAGVVDPATDEVVVGSAANWLLAARAASAPSIVLGALGANLQPSVRRFDLDAGEWGMGFDVVLDVGAAPIDYRGMYWSAGPPAE